MDAEEKFIGLSALICEPSRAKMLWNLLDGRAYTASELSLVGDISPTSTSNHLTKLLEAGLLKVETQGRHRYFSFSRPEVAYVVESLANLAKGNTNEKMKVPGETKGVKFCRTCYDHLAGFVGVRITEAFEDNGLIEKADKTYIVTKAGWTWFANFDISENAMLNQRRPITRQCLDWSERRPHLAGQLGALVLNRMLEKQWFKKVKFSRELVVTYKGQQELYSSLKIEV